MNNQYNLAFSHFRENDISGTQEFFASCGTSVSMRKLYDGK
jgi:hypothetical protein